MYFFDVCITVNSIFAKCPANANARGCEREREREREGGGGVDSTWSRKKALRKANNPTTRGHHGPNALRPINAAITVIGVVTANHSRVFVWARNVRYHICFLSSPKSLGGSTEGACTLYFFLASPTFLTATTHAHPLATIPKAGHARALKDFWFLQTVEDMESLVLFFVGFSTWLFTVHCWHSLTVDNRQAFRIWTQRWASFNRVFANNLFFAFFGKILHISCHFLSFSAYKNFV